MSTREMKLLYLLALVTCAALCVGLGGCATATPADALVTAAATESMPVDVPSVVKLPTAEQQQIQTNIVREEKASMYAEGAWLLLDAVDTMQTARIAREPSKYYEADPIAAAIYGSKHPKEGVVIGVNVGLAFAHTLVASWLDDKVAEHEEADPNGSLGGWYVARIAFHVLSLGYSGEAVIHNYSIGLKP